MKRGRAIGDASWDSDTGEEGTPRADSDAPLFDPEGARRQLGLDASSFTRIFECIWLEVSERRSRLEEAFAAGDLARVALHAHTIKSSAATIGAGALSKAAAAVERAADDGRIEELAAAIAAFHRAKETLSKLLGMG